jgi:hypothetical protein
MLSAVFDDYSDTKVAHEDWSMSTSVRNHALTAFFILAYVFAWLQRVPEAAAGRGLIHYLSPIASRRDDR